MIPSYFVKLEKLPLSPNGKLNRQALLETEGELLLSAGDVLENEIEILIASIWESVLGHQHIRTDSNFLKLVETRYHL